MSSARRMLAASKWRGRPERLADLKRKAGYGMSWGIEGHVISPSEAREFIPMLSERILGALYVPSDIQTKATRPAEAMAREAERNGGSFYGGVKVTGFGIDGGRITAVQTSHGDIRTELVIACAGIWAPKIGGYAGVPIPLSPMSTFMPSPLHLKDLRARRKR